MKTSFILLTLIVFSIFPLESGSHNNNAKVYQVDESVMNQQYLLQLIKNIEFAAKIGSGESVDIDLNTTEGLEGEVVQIVGESFKVQKSFLETLIQRIKSFF